MTFAARAHTRYLKAIAVFCRHSASGFTRSVGSAVALASGASSAEFNSVFIDGPRPLRGDVRTAAGWIRDEGLPLCIVVRQGVDDAMRPLAGRMGLRRDPWVGPLMASDRAPESTAASGPTLRDGPTVDGAHRRLIAEGFGVDRALVDGFIGRGFADDPAVRIVVGMTMAGDPVATGTGVLVDDTICVFNVATLEAHRGVGFGAAITTDIVEQGFRAGATLAVLESSQAAVAMYERLGFTTVARYERWKSR